MASQPREDAHAIYLKSKNGWFWVVPQGQRSIYHGPYGTQAAAEAYQTDVDTYAHDRGDE